MLRRPCLGWGGRPCAQLVSPPTQRCPPHQALRDHQVDATRGGTTERGYGSAWQRQARETLRPLGGPARPRLPRLGTPCARIDRPGRRPRCRPALSWVQLTQGGHPRQGASRARGADFDARALVRRRPSRRRAARPRGRAVPYVRPPNAARKGCPRLAPPRAEAIAAACEQVIAGHEMSDSGQAHHDAPDDDPVLTPKQIASQYEVDRRTAQRWCRKFGFEDDGRLFVRRSALEMVR